MVLCLVYSNSPDSGWKDSSVTVVLRLDETLLLGLCGSSGMNTDTRNAMMTRSAPNANGGPGTMLCVKQVNKSYNFIII